MVYLDTVAAGEEHDNFPPPSGASCGRGSMRACSYTSFPDNALFRCRCHPRSSGPSDGDPGGLVRGQGLILEELLKRNIRDCSMIRVFP